MNPKITDLETPIRNVGKAREMADHFDFADFGETFDGGAREFRAERLRGIDCRDIERR